MIKQIIISFLVLTVISCNRGDKNDYTVSMILTGFEDSTKFKLLDLDKLEFIDSAYSVDGKLQFKGNVKKPFTARIHTIDDKYIILWIEDKEITIKGDYEDLFYSRIEGSVLNSVMTTYRDKQRELQMQRDSLMHRMIKLMSDQSANAKGEFEELMNLVNSIDKEVFKIRLNGIVSEQPSYFTIQELYFLRNDISKDSLKLLFNKFPKYLQTTKYGDVIRTSFENKVLSVGDRYVDIEGLNEQGKLIKLSQLKGKYILLDFWASWCGPCRQENPNLVKAYKTYSNKGFEIFSFSIDNNIDSWQRAVMKDSLTWTHVIDKNGSYSKMSALYGVKAIPASFLINPEGIIIARDLRGNSLEEKLKAEFRNRGL